MGSAAEDDFAQFVRACSPRLLRAGWLLLGDWPASEDLVQTALERTWPKWGKLADEPGRLAYVHRVMTTSYLSEADTAAALRVSMGAVKSASSRADDIAGRPARRRTAQRGDAAMTDLERGMARLLDEAAPAPERVLDPDAIRRAHGRRRRRTRHLVIGPALGAALVVVLAVTLARWPRDGGGPQTLRSGPGVAADSSHAAPAATVTPRLVTQQVADQALAALRVPPSARPITDSQAHGILGPFSEPGSPNVVDRHRIWTVTGTVAAVTRYITAHLPAGMSADGTASSYGRGGTIDTGITLALDRRWQRPGVFDELAVLLTFTQRGSEVGVRADAQAIWLPPRTPDQHVTLTVTSVDVVFHRGPGIDPIRATLDAAHASGLARLIDVATVSPPGPYMCPMQRADDAISLRFHGPGGDRSATVEPSGCARLTVGSGPALNPPVGLVSAIRTALGVH